MSKKENNTAYYVGLGIIVAIIGYFAIHNIVHYINKNKVVESNRTTERAPVADKFLHKHNPIPEFTLVNQAGDTISNEDLKGKVAIIKFFFTSCPTICKPMTANLTEAYKQLGEREDFLLLSISIDPEYDQPERLKKYADQFKVGLPTWHFLTGDSAEIFQLADQGFKLPVAKSEDPNVRFEHSGNVVLIDREGNIRSRKDQYGNFIYAYSAIDEGGQPSQVKELIEDATTLLNK